MKTVFVDVDTQLDFLYPAGALYVPGAEQIVDRIAALNRFACSHGIPVVSTMDAHAEDDPEFRDWPPHCVAGTAGQHKPASTLLERRVLVPNTQGLREVGGAQQILLEKQALNCFTNVNLRDLLSRLAAERYVVYGVVTEICVKCAAFGLLEMGGRIEIATDVVKELDISAQAQMFEEFTAKGGILTNSTEIVSEVYH
ncbi:MAG: cysteine hydrolase [Bryobacterales bacterium]|nr:cysteine hydrolase [Bryobacterales bacterium]MBV9400342.1 cysteine hydrolase [Bryobacterales bacterium]